MQDGREAGMAKTEKWSHSHMNAVMVILRPPIGKVTDEQLLLTGRTTQ